MNFLTDVGRRPDLGRVGSEVAEALAWLNSPATIASEIGRLEAAIHDGDWSDATRAMLHDWQAVQQAQRLLVAAGGRN